MDSATEKDQRHEMAMKEVHAEALALAGSALAVLAVVVALAVVVVVVLEKKNQGLEEVRLAAEKRRV